MPVRGGAGGAIYRRLRFGRLAELSMLDLRTYRSQQAGGTAVDDPDRTIAGDAQLAWLRDGLANSTARWKLVGNPVVPSVTSDNVNDFLRLPAGNSLSRLGVDVIRTTNPHVRWAELDGHGYAVLEVTAQRCRMDWYHLADRTSASTASRWVAGWSVGAGSSRLRAESAPLA